MSTDMVKYTDERGAALTVTAKDVREMLVHGNGQLTDQEVARFLWLCEGQRLNPFLGDAYLIKYGSDASMVVSKDVHVRRAGVDPAYDGHEAGVIVGKGGGLEYREGAFVVKGEALLGGWVRVYRKDRSHPVFVAVSFDEYAARTKDGQLNRQWSTKGATMIVKVAESQGLRKAFPERLEKLYAAEEMDEVVNRDGTEATVTATVVDITRAVELKSKNETPPADNTKDLAADYWKRLTTTQAITDKQRTEALAKLAAHKTDVAYLTTAITRLDAAEAKWKAEIDAVPDETAERFDAGTHEDVPFEDDPLPEPKADPKQKEIF